MSQDTAKQDIQYFWGSLYDSLYKDVDQELTCDDLMKGLDDLEDMFRSRGHMAVADMPLSSLSGKRVLEIGPGAGGIPPCLPNMAASGFRRRSPTASPWRSSDDPEDEDVAMDPDEDLPWPDLQLVHGWWDANKSRFTSGRRYLVGKPVTMEHCQHVLRNGYQRQRNAAALELALMEPDAPLFETRAPGFRQQRQLGQ